MSKPDTRGWGTPGKPGSQVGRDYEAAHIETVTVQGRKLRVRREAAPLFLGFLGDLEKEGYRIDGGTVVDDWGFAHRYINRLGKPVVGSLSNHAWGLAIDINSLKNPQQKRVNGKPIVQDLPANVNELAARWGLFWGGNFETLPDPMHFEYLGTPDAIAGILARNGAPTTPTKPTPSTPSTPPPPPAHKPPAGGTGTKPATPKAGTTKPTSKMSSVTKLAVSGLATAAALGLGVLGVQKMTQGAPT